MAPRGLVVFYSMSGTTRALANEIRDACLGHLEEILEPRARRGLPGVARALFDALARREPPIQRAQRDPALYDVLLLGGPIWAGRLAAPVRSYARKYGARASRLAFFCTQGGSDPGPAFADLARLCGRQPEAVLSVPAGRLGTDAVAAEVADFIAAAMPALPTRRRAAAYRRSRPATA